MHVSVVYAGIRYVLPSTVGTQLRVSYPNWQSQRFGQGGVSILGDPAQARAACVTDEGVPRGSSSLQPGFIMRWQNSDLSQLPQALADRLASGRYRRAEVGSCPTRGGEGSFTAYRVAVILY